MTEEKTQTADGVVSELNAELDTEETRKERITQENNYWSPAYADMCRKVDELINARIEIEKLRQTIKNEADYNYKLALYFYGIKDFFRASQHKERGNKLMSSI